MPQRPTYQPGSYYHLYNRGRSRLSICHQPQDFMEIIQRFKKYSRKYAITVIAYVLLPNHYHLLVRQDDQPRASLLPQRTFNGYGKWYNRKYDHSGTIFEGTTKAKLVSGERYLRHLCRYIHANPVLHGFARSIDEWEYSNFHEWVGIRRGALVDHNFISKWFGTAAAYQQFVLNYLQNRNHPDGFDALIDWD